MRYHRKWLLLSAGALLVGSCTDSTSPDALVVKLAFLVQPQATTAGTPISPPIAVALEDASGQTVTGAHTAVTLGLGANPGNSRLAGSTTVTAVNGIATFRGLSLGVSDSGYTLTASIPGLPSETSDTFSITPGPAVRLAFGIQPASPSAGAPIPVTVRIVDAFGNLVTSSTSVVALTLSGPAGATLEGTTSVVPVNGVATFNDLSVQQAGLGYSLGATSAGVAPVLSNAFDVLPAAPDRLAFTVQPGNALLGMAISPAVQVAIQDAFGNTIPTATSAVTLTLGTNPGNGTLSGTLTMIAVGGVASFGNVRLDQPGVGYTLAAASGTLTGATSQPFSASNPKLAFTVEPVNAVLGLAISPPVRVAIQDPSGNPIPTADNPVTLALGANPGNATLSGTLTVNAVGGVASFGNLKLDQLGVGYTLVASSGTLTGATSQPFNVTIVRLMAFVRENQSGAHVGIATMTTAGSNITPLTDIGESPLWSPDGTRIAFLSNGTVAVMNADGSGQVTLQLGLGSSVTGLAWKPDGTRIAFSGSYSYSTGLFLIDPDGSNVTRIVPGPATGMYPSWSPDGTRLVWACQPPLVVGLCLFNADGSGMTLLAQNGIQPAWKPDGSSILFVGSGLTLINPDGTGATPLGVNGLLPAWSGDGQQIAFVIQGRCLGGWSSSSGCSTYLPDSIRVANADGSGSHAIAAGSAPAWQP